MTVAPRDVPRPPSLLGSYLPPVLFLLVCGVVGPIFLVMGIAMGDQPDAGWLLPIGVSITVLDLVIGVLIGRGRYRSAKKLHRLRTNGRPARGQVLSFDSTNVRINDQPLLKLRLRIHGDDVAPFEVESRTVVPDLRMPLLYTGELPVLVDPESREWEIDWDAAEPVAPLRPSVAVRPPDQKTPAERLAELDDLLKRDLVSREEYDATRARILGGI
ncbi:SHOCT domain-containing protein [Nocardioides sp. QY071]|uniref:SHOCT domain-containing protein n=1 Tax=Nocardioides sp. QY071 TaxID=3044187 RepID=UPI00249A9CFC|nr:SHOCT domain-containing protein [Nocardioides sp. QY071]WGY01856.1 SHOCT domain-containing protein [Nocardioides sp. QY071]